MEGLTPIRPIAPSYLLSVAQRDNRLHVLQGTALDTARSKTGPDQTIHVKFADHITSVK